MNLTCIERFILRRARKIIVRGLIDSQDNLNLSRGYRQEEQIQEQVTTFLDHLEDFVKHRGLTGVHAKTLVRMSKRIRELTSTTNNIVAHLHCQVEMFRDGRRAIDEILDYAKPRTEPL